MLCCWLQKGRMALHDASSQCNVKAVQALLDAKADKCAKDNVSTVYFVPCAWHCLQLSHTAHGEDLYVHR